MYGISSTVNSLYVLDSMYFYLWVKRVTFLQYWHSYVRNEHSSDTNTGAFRITNTYVIIHSYLRSNILSTVQYGTVRISQRTILTSNIMIRFNIIISCTCVTITVWQIHDKVRYRYHTGTFIRGYSTVPYWTLSLFLLQRQIDKVVYSFFITEQWYGTIHTSPQSHMYTT